MMSRNILIVGNGFDLAHYLPTKYEHFIHAMSILEEYKPNSVVTFKNLFQQNLDNEDFFIKRTFEMYKTETVQFSEQEANKLREKLKKNGWFRHFKNYLESGIGTWIDFENEINKTLDVVCSILEKNTRKNEILNKRINIDNINIISDVFFTELFYDSKDFILEQLSNLGLAEHTFIKRTRNKYQIETGGEIKYLINNDFLKFNKTQVIGINTSKIVDFLSSQLIDFIDIFESYILLIEKLEPVKELKDIYNYQMVFSFNYSNTINRLSKYSKTIRFLHGKAGSEENNKLVIGISELENELLKSEKAYDFVKYYQKLLNQTQHHFIRNDYLTKDLVEFESKLSEDKEVKKYSPYNIYIWGHSLDSSDADYVQEVFSFNRGYYSFNKGYNGDHSIPRRKERPTIKVTVYYFRTAHAQLANLIHILGKDLVETWMKNGWLEFKKSPDIYNENFGNSLD